MRPLCEDRLESLIQVDNRLCREESPQLGNACCISVFFMLSYIYKQKLRNRVIVVSKTRSLLFVTSE